MKLTKEEAKDADFLTLPPDTIVQVEVVGKPEVRTVPGKSGGDPWQSLNVRFKIIDIPDHLQDEFGFLVGSTIFGSVSARFTSHPDNKLNQWATALLDIGELDTGFELDTDAFEGRRARGVIGNYTKSTGQVNHKIAALLAPRSALVSAQPSLAQFDNDEPPF